MTEARDSEIREPAPVRLAFVQGIATGVVACGILIHIWLGIHLTDTREMYRNFGGQLPALTELTTSQAWLWGIPAVAAGVLVFLVGKRSRSMVPYLTTAALLVATIAGTWYFANEPIRRLSGLIR